MGNDMWDVAIDRRYTKLVEKLLMLISISEWDQPAVFVHVKYAISTKMEVLNLSLRGPNYSSLPFAKMDIGE
ncbi:hypothetical protein C5167_044100 [Papaver somniferum]|uniref:Uncharacterized protein n=1 Tax=Papaver somniferum TaxID=3469 RepID=A0A4Y7L974_PAPSO|nr:hypothetical protein C5167_044100 [Papaver somniferum]